MNADDIYQRLRRGGYIIAFQKITFGLYTIKKRWVYRLYPSADTQHYLVYQKSAIMAAMRKYNLCKVQLNYHKYKISLCEEVVAERAVNETKDNQHGRP